MNTIVGLLAHPLCHRVGWTLLHSVWQGALVAGLFGLVRRASRRASAQARYVTACVALVALAGAPLITFFAGFGGLIPPSRAANPAIQQVGPGTLVTSAANSVRPVEFANGASGLLVQALDGLERALPALVAFWMAGVAFLLCRWAHGGWQVRRFRMVDIEPIEAEWVERFEALKARLNISRPVRLLKSTLVEVPMVIGWLRPVILLPAATVAGLSPAELEAILAHELAHVYRFDYFVNLCQLTLETLMFYHPAVWWISRCVREERELCCDDLVVRFCGDRLTYARALASLEESRASLGQLAFAASSGPLLRRIRRLLGDPNSERPATAREIGGLGLATLGGVLVILGLLSLMQPGSYQACSRLKLARDHPDSQGTGYAPSEVYDPYFLQSQFQVLGSALVLEPVIESLKLDEAWGRRYRGGTKLSAPESLNLLQSHLSLRPIRNTTLLEVMVLDDDPAEAARIANAIAEHYQQYRRDEHQRVSQRTIQALRARCEEQFQKIREAQSNLDTSRAKLGISDLSLTDPVSVRLASTDTLRRFESMRIQTQAEMVRQSTLLACLRNIRPEKRAQTLASAGVEDLFLGSLLELQVQAQQKLVALNQEYGPDHSEVVKVRSQVADLQSKIKDRVEATMIGLQARLDAMQASLVTLSNDVNAATERDGQRSVEAKAYWEALRNLEDLTHVGQMLDLQRFTREVDSELPQAPMVEIVESAVPSSRRVAPRQTRATVLLTSGLLLMALGLTLARTGQGPTSIITPMAPLVTT